VWRCARSLERSCVQIKLCNNYELLLKSCIVLQQLVVADQDAELSTLQNSEFWRASFGAADRGRKRTLELSFVACLILIKLRIADAFELFLWQRVVGFVAHVVLMEIRGLKSLQIAEKALRSSFMMIACHNVL